MNAPPIRLNVILRRTAWERVSVFLFAACIRETIEQAGQSCRGPMCDAGYAE